MHHMIQPQLYIWQHSLAKELWRLRRI